MICRGFEHSGLGFGLQGCRGFGFGVVGIKSSVQGFWGLGCWGLGFTHFASNERVNKDFKLSCCSAYRDSQWLQKLSDFEPWAYNPQNSRTLNPKP